MAERTNPHANLIIGAQDEASPVFDKIKASSQSMAEGVKQAAKQAAKETQLLGDEAEKSRKKMQGMSDPAVPAAQTFDRATSSMVRQVQRLNAELEAGSARNAAYFEKMANIKGADTAALAPYLAQLKQAEAAQRVATTGLDHMGMSAKQTTAALRQVPMQFTDIVVSLQGGQSAMQVFLQQGGQLKDMFGGAGNAARALGGYVIGLVNPFTVAAAAVAGFGLAMASVNSKDAALLALSTQLAATGRASAGAVGEIKALVKELNLIPGVSKASATAIITEFAKVNGIGSDLFKSLGSSVADFAAATGTDLPTAAKKLADAFADPAKGAQALEGALGTLTAAQILTIEKMAAMGDKSGAQVAMMDALKQATEGLAKQGMTPLGEATDKMSNAWDALTTSIGNSEAFRTANSWLATLIEKVAELTVKLSQMKPPTWLQFLPGVGPAIGALTMAAGASSGSRSVSGVVGTWDEGGATGSWGPTASETEQQVKAAIAATRGYETQAAAMEKLRGVASQAKDALKELESQNRGDSVEAMRLRDSIAAINEKLADMRKKGAPKGPTKETISEYDKLIKKLSDGLPRAAAEAEAAQMGYNKAQTEFLELAGSDVWASFTNSQRAFVASLFEGKIASEQAGDAAKTLAKANLEAAQSREKYIASLATGLDKIQADIAVQIEATQRMGLSKEAIAALDAAKLEMLATDLELQAIKAMDRNLDEQTYDALKKQAQAYRDLAKAKQDGAAKETMVDMAKSGAEEWKRTADSINKSLTDALMRGFESGKDFAKNMRDTVINMFKTMVLRPVISVIVNPVAGAVTGMMGLSGPANASTGVAGQAGSSFLSSAGGSMLGNMGGIGAGFMSGVSETMLGSAFVGPSASAAGGATGMAAQLGAAAPYLAAAVAIYAIAKSLDDSGTYHTGGAAQYSAATGLRTSLGFRDNEEGLPSYNPNDNIDNQFGTGFGYVVRGDQTISAVSGIAQGLSATLDGVAVAFGEKAGYAVATAFADDTSKDGAWGALRISKDGQELLNWQDTRTSRWAPKEFGDGEAGYKEYLAAVAKDTRQVLLDMDLPSWADKMLESIGDSASMDQLTGVLTQIGVVQSAFVALGNSMDMFANLSGEMQSGLLAAAGSIDALTAGAGAFYQGFYSEQERVDAAVAQLNKALAGLDLSIDPTLGDDAKDQFRAEVEKAFAAGDAELAASLLAISGNFASAADYFEQLSQSAADAAAQAAGQAAQVAELSAAEQASIAGDLRRQIYELTGDTEAIRRLEIAGMNAANVALYDRVQALQAEAEQASIRAQAEAEQASIRADLERQILELQGDSAALRALDIAGMDAYNVSLFDQVRATEAAAQAEQELAAKRAQIAQERYGLETQLLQAQGNTAALRARELELIDPSNQPLQQQIWALQDMAQAAKLASDAERELIAARVQSAQDAYNSAQSATSAALSSVDRAVGAQREGYDAARSAALEAAQEVKSLIDTLSSGIKGLYGEVESARTASAAEGLAFIDNALRNARATGYLPDSSALNDAITSASAGIGAKQYTSQADQDFDRLVLAGQLKELNGYAEPQLTAAEQAARIAEDQIKALDDILRNARDQVDELRGIDTSVKTIPEALAALQAALVGEMQAQTAAFLSGIVANLSGGQIRPQDAIQQYESKAGEVPREQWTDLAGTQAWVSTGGATALGGTPTSGLDAMISSKTGAQFTVRTATDYVNDAVRKGDLRAIYDAAVLHGISSTSLDAMMGWPGGTALDWAKSQGLPAFAVGTNYVPRDMVARIHEGEAIVPKAYNPAAGGSGGQSNARLEALIEKLNAEVAELKGLQRDSNRNTRRTAEAVNGNPDAPILVTTV